MKAYYNEFDPKAAQWLRQLIANGLIMDGIVDDRSIIEVTPDDLKGFTRHHFFAGIGGWELALQLADWPIDRPVCTASLPCQPFSVAGAQKGKEDERHLLPHFIELVKQCNFQTIFGEQVPGAIKHGWLDDLCLEMEREKYTVGAIVLTAAGEGAPHIRQRLYWVADSSATRLQGHGRPEQAMYNQARNGGRTGRTFPGNLREQVDEPMQQVYQDAKTDAQNGLTQTGYIAETKSTGQLNPALSRWLMGFPEEWDIAAIQASRLYPTIRKKCGS